MCACLTYFLQLRFKTFHCQTLTCESERFVQGLIKIIFYEAEVAYLLQNSSYIISSLFHIFLHMRSLSNHFEPECHFKTITFSFIRMRARSDCQSLAQTRLVSLCCIPSTAQHRSTGKYPRSHGGCSTMTTLQLTKLKERFFKFDIIWGKTALL